MLQESAAAPKRLNYIPKAATLAATVSPVYLSRLSYVGCAGTVGRIRSYLKTSIDKVHGDDKFFSVELLVLVYIGERPVNKSRVNALK